MMHIYKINNLWALFLALLPTTGTDLLNCSNYRFMTPPVFCRDIVSNVFRICSMASHFNIVGLFTTVLENDAVALVDDDIELLFGPPLAFAEVAFDASAEESPPPYSICLMSVLVVRLINPSNFPSNIKLVNKLSTSLMGISFNAIAMAANDIR